MELLNFRINLLVGLFLSGFCVQSSVLPPPHAFLPRAPRPWSHGFTHDAHQQQKEREHVNTIGVICHPDSLEVVIKADMFAVGTPVNSDELRLGVEDSDYCRAAAFSEDEYRISVGLADCGTKHWMTEDSLVYTNLLIYSPVASPNGVVRMEEAVVPIECHYKRKYSLSSAPLQPTWIPFTFTQTGLENLKFSLKLMTDDWQHERGVNVFYLGEPISIEASVGVGHHMGLRVFMSSCVATLHPDTYSEPRYTFIENGCLVDSQLPGSRAFFLPRRQDDKLQLVIDAFRFHNDDKAELYITCHLTAVPVNDAESPNKACTFINGRWRSADGNDYLCGYCQGNNEVVQPRSKPISHGRFGPRGFGKPAEPEPMRKSGLKTNQVWEDDAKLGPVTVLQSQKSKPLPAAELPVVLKKIDRPTLHSSQWKSGINEIELEKELLPDPATPDPDEKYDKTAQMAKQKKKLHL
ncbi:zona pellucida sperm-binding protein 3-like isoform X2 [Archocentrus centrarchus]|uniref:zona pellucida sperm-binding protein 3-like isoform X2 n=1 Tax=Archocentrus centrarchus TaxID=63155 RepID=UPI0011E9EC2C|nr:zona pellucida sperm-binding protein 3-like isoform X2 [Archocentrus centrarchus]